MTRDDELRAIEAAIAGGKLRRITAAEAEAYDDVQREARHGPWGRSVERPFVSWGRKAAMPRSG